ncbi:hypothetical protein Lal_00014478 [Lupinus albus]|nr:hypothetical protein Lal_00014478 [Lupinus albus]
MGKDIIADIITSIRNADMNRKVMVQIPFTNINVNIVKILLREGFIQNVRKNRENDKYFLVLTLRYRRNRKGSYKPVLILKRISTPGLRIYSNYQRIPRILGGMGIVIISTSRGIITDREARLERIGRESPKHEKGIDFWEKIEEEAIFMAKARVEAKRS